MSKPSISRRTVLGASFAASDAAVLPAVASAATSAGGPDAALLKLAQEYWQIENGLTCMGGRTRSCFRNGCRKRLRKSYG